MNAQTDHLNQTDEDMLADTVSDEALEAAAAMEKGGITSLFYIHFTLPHQCC